MIAPYFILFLILLTFSFLSLDRIFLLRINKIILFSILSLLIAMLGFRYGVANDFFSYQNIFDSLDGFDKLGFFTYNLSESTPVESLFAVFMLSVKELTNSYAIYVFLLAIISTILKYIAFKKLSPFIVLSFLIYFSDEWFWKDLSGSRVALASTFILFSAYFAYLRRGFAFLFFLLLAILCHSSAIIALPIYFFRGIFVNKYTMYFSLFLSVLIAKLGGIGIFLTNIANSMGIDADSRMIKYVDSEYVDGITVFGGTFSLNLLISYLMILFYKQLTNKWKYNEILVPMYVYGTVMFFSLIDYGIVAGRVREMLTVNALCVSLPTFILIFKNKQKLFAFLGITAYCVVFFYMMVRTKPPYQSIFLNSFY